MPRQTDWGVKFPQRSEPNGGITVKSKPDVLLVLLAAFGVGVLVTMMLPVTTSDSIAAPASELQAGIIIQ